MHTKAFPYILLLGLLWGSNLVVSRFAVGQFGGVMFAGLRLAVAGLAFVLVFLVTSRPFPRDRRLWRHAATLGVLGTAVPMTSMVSSLQFQSSGVTALLITTSPAFMALAAHLFLPDEKLNRNKSIGVFLALSGALLIVSRGETGLAGTTVANPIGYLLVLIAILFETAGAMYIRTYMRQLDPFDVSAIRVCVAGLVVLPLGFLWQGIDAGQVTPQGIVALVYAGLAAAFAGQLMAFYVTQRFGATAFSLTAYIIPVVAAVLGVLLLDEKVTSWMGAGMVLVILGIMLINRRQKEAPVQVFYD